MMFDVRGTGIQQSVDRRQTGATALNDRTANLSTPPAEYVWLYYLLTDPTLTRYDAAQRLRVALLIAYSGRRGTPGVLEQADGYLCNAIGLGRKLTQFRRCQEAFRVDPLAGIKN